LPFGILANIDWLSFIFGVVDCDQDKTLNIYICFQRYQNKVLKCIINTPWYVRNIDLHHDLGIETVTDIIAKFTKSHEKRLQDPHQHRSLQTSKREQYHQTTQTKETV
jgi:hypothetical protein